MTELLRERDIRFLLYEFLDTTALLGRERYREHSREVFDATVDAARALAEKYLLPHYQKGDAEEVELVDGGVRMLPEVLAAYEVVAESGFLKMTADAEEGGLQLPEVISRVALAYFLAGNCAASSAYFLTLGVINLLRSFASPEQKALYLPLLTEGLATGTMALSEPAQGSSLADIRTRAEPQPDGSWRLFGQKMFITAGDNDIAGNIIHMVLARTKDAPPGVQGISLFIVPKFMLLPDGSPGERNDVATAGVLHKMGQRQSPTTVLNFGEKNGAVGWMISGEGKGLACMFQMMNEARIGVGVTSAALALRAYLYSLDYAKQRPQGRLPSNKSPLSPQVPIVEHADVRRMLLAQKSYAEGALALCLYAASLFEDQHTHPDAAGRERAGLLLDLLTPVVKSWSARYGCASNDLAIQVLGGSGYVREYPVEQLYRDQRINPIHEGAEGIHGLDILGRKVRLAGGAAMRYFGGAVRDTVRSASKFAEIADLGSAVEQHLLILEKTTDSLAALCAREPDVGLSNATVYLDAFGRVAVAWIWLMQSLAAARHEQDCDSSQDGRAFYAGKRQAARFYIEWELPMMQHLCHLLGNPNLLPYRTTAEML